LAAGTNPLGKLARDLLGDPHHAFPLDRAASRRVVVDRRRSALPFITLIASKNSSPQLFKNDARSSTMAQDCQTVRLGRAHSIDLKLPISPLGRLPDWSAPGGPLVVWPFALMRNPTALVDLERHHHRGSRDTLHAFRESWDKPGKHPKQPIITRYFELDMHRSTCNEPVDRALDRVLALLSPTPTEEFRN
jgi:hypothetical protein